MADSPSKPAVYVTEASAGSGKTYCLARHYLKLLFTPGAHPQQIETILAVTFTNKAAREMKERILDVLTMLALDEFPDSAHQQQLLASLGLDKKTASRKARQLLDYILENYSYFAVKTIDSFINMILLGCAYRIGLSANFRIREDRARYLAYSLDACIDKAASDPRIAELINGFIFQYLYLEGRTGWFPKKDILDLLGTMFYHSNTFGGLFVKSPHQSKDVILQKRAILKELAGFSAKLPEGVNAIFAKTLSNFSGRHAEGFDFADVAAKKAFRKEEIPCNKGKSVPAELKQQWDRIRLALSRSAEAEAGAMFNCYIDIFAQVYSEFREIARKADALFLEELNQQAYALINENGVTVPELYYRLATRLAHFLIDEFQDTSLLQWRNIYPMIQETLSTGGSLFYVGDKKQAIFRFRGGEAALFEGIKEELRAYVQVDYLHQNFRSRRAIVEFNNAVFSPENIRRFMGCCNQQTGEGLKEFTSDDLEQVSGIFSNSAQQFRSEPGYELGHVSAQVVEYSGPQEKEMKIKERVFALLAQLTDTLQLQYKDICILCRGNSDVALVSSWLIAAGLPVESEKTLNIKNNKYINEIIAFLTFLNSPIDNLAFAAFILGEIFQAASGLEARQVRDFIFESRPRSRRDEAAYLYREFRRRYPEVWQNFIADFFKRIGFVGLYELVTDIYRVFRTGERFNQQQGFFMHFLQVIKNSEQEHQGIDDFLDYLETVEDAKLFVNSSAVSAVKVMTIHKAKGLGFGAVIVPFFELNLAALGSGSRRDKGDRISYVVDPEDDGLHLVRLDTKYAWFSPAIRERYRSEYKKSFIDELNSMYVALTRPRDALYILIPHQEIRGNNAARFLVPAGFSEHGGLQAYSSGAMPEGGTISLADPVYQDWCASVSEEFIASADLSNRAAIARGTALHEILARIGPVSEDDWEAILDQAVKFTQTVYTLGQDFAKLRGIVAKVMIAKETKRFFFLSEAQVYQEKEMVNLQGRNLRIDRLIVGADFVWIVDFKSSADSTVDYAKQLNAYRECVSEIYPDKPVSCYLIFLDEARVEEVYG